MKNVKLFITTTLAIFIVTVMFGQSSEKLVSSKTHIKFFSETPAENIEANNYTSVSTLNKKTGEIVFSVPMQGFEFEKSLMQKHYNSPKYLDTKAYPKAKFVAKITDLSKVDFSKGGTYNLNVEGTMTLKGVSKEIKEKATIVVKNGMIEGKSKFNLTLADYGITFIKGKPSTNIAKTLDITVLAQY